MSNFLSPSPFHRGEREIQARLGVRDAIEDTGQRFIRDYMPDQHRAFYAQLPFVLIGTVDQAGRPWASVLAGRPGFAQSPDRDTLKIRARPVFGDPLNTNLSVGLPVGLLGIEYQSRRRNRMNGRIKTLNESGIEIKVDQTFGNCPQYIQARNFELLPEIDTVGDERSVWSLDSFSDRARDVISSADNFYIATHYCEDANDSSHGADVSHRGGKPGFVRIDDGRTLTFPDFPGNYHFNTIGNLLLNPRAGLLFIDFESGDLLYLTGSAKILWEGTERRAFDGAERLVRFELDEGRIVEQALPIRWKFIDYAPSLEKTGSWEEVSERVAARQNGNVYRQYQVLRLEPESEMITSFYLYPEDNDGIHCHKAGQFLPIEIQPPGAAAPIQRTYTISNAPNGAYYRLSIKREAPPRPDLPAGLASSYFHDHVKVGTRIRALSPRGQFTLDESGNRPLVLISGGVGITPMISMLEQLAKDTVGCGCQRQVWFIHGARNGKEQAFAGQVRDLAQNWPCLTVHFRYSQPLDSEVQGTDYDSVGHVDMPLLKSLLRFDDYEFYLCGPPAFMESLYAGLKSLKINDERIHYEFFGPGAALYSERPSGFESLPEALGNRPPVAVRFDRSDIEATWEPSQGTLLDLAESKGLQPAYSCRSGICQTCAIRVVSGTVDYLEPPMTPPPTDQALICCAYPRPKTNGDSEDDGLVLDL